MFMNSLETINSKGKTRRILVVGLVSVLLISVLFMGCIEEEDQESPEDTFSLFVERINEGDGEGVIELFDTQFLDDDIWEELPQEQEEFEEEMDAMEKAIDNGEMEIESYETEVTYLEDMDEDSSPLNRTELEEFMETVNENEYFTATVYDICMVEFEWNATVEEDSILEFWDELDEIGETDWGMLIMIEIEEEWYIGFTGLAGILYVEVGDDLEPQPITGHISHHEGTIFEIMTLAQPSSANPSDVKITVLGEDYEELDEGYIDQDDWLLLSDGEVVSGSRFDLDDISPAEITEEDIREVVIRIDGYSGTISAEI